MTKIIVTYDARDTVIQGETCCEIEVSNAVADALLAQGNTDSNQERVQHALEELLLRIEPLKGRHYVWNSIKDIRLAK